MRCDDVLCVQPNMEGRREEVGRGGTGIILPIVQTRKPFKVNLLLMKTIHTEYAQILCSVHCIFIK